MNAPPSDDQYVPDLHNARVENWKSFEEKVAQSIRSNAVIFFRRAATEIASHDDSTDMAFDHETGTIVTVLTQMALELAVASFLVRHDGIRSILAKPENFTDDQIREKWLDNELRTKTFEGCKRLLADSHPSSFRDLDGVADMFQKSRNKIMHLHFRFAEDDLYDLKFESTFVLIHTVSHFLFEDEFDHSNNIASLLTADTFSKLIRFPPYQYHVEQLAKEYSRLVLRCPICEQLAFSDLEGKCFSCTYEDAFVDLLVCPTCDQRSVIYDHLNLAFNEKLPSLCLHCEEKQEVFKCGSCRDPMVGSAVALDCATCANDQLEDGKK